MCGAVTVRTRAQAVAERSPWQAGAILSACCILTHCISEQPSEVGTIITPLDRWEEWGAGS